jgi:Ubiquitin family
MSETFSSSDPEVEADRKVLSTDDSASSSSPFWTLQIKPVGEEADFSITLHPDDDILQLYQHVASRTGVPQEQQRLIYRGRLIPNARPKQEDDSATASHKEGASVVKYPPHQQKIKDIVGLTNGHSIHFVRRTPKQDEEGENELSADNEAARVVLDPATATSSSSSSSGTSSLLSALLGGSSQRRTAHRLREEDWVRPDPGSMETVRQGLLTLHTLQSSSDRRHFYRGQWIDCRDTVNMWLEATVVDILYPQDILQSYSVTSSGQSTLTSRNPSVVPTSDPPIAVTDLEGRRRLLLEPCTDPAEAVECMDGMYYRLRLNNEGVQILHVHYNGWPVRWDEWIRSDSERIRPFRVRTLHDGSSTSPNIDAVMPDAPTTYIAGEDEPSDRRALLPELHRVLGVVQARLESVVTSTASASSTSVAPNPSNPLPWLPTDIGEVQTRTSQRQQQQALEQLAPFLDRLGRILVDAAPQVLALADAVGQESDDAEEDEEEPDPSPPLSTLGGLLSLLSVRDRGNRHGSVASSNAAVPSVVSDVEVSLASSTTGEPAAHADEEEEEIEEEDDEAAAATVDPDLRDFSTGIVNTTRGEVRNRSRSSDDATASLLGAYLAAMSLSDSGGGVTEGLGRLFRGNGTGGGIDIHIHAVVTAPGLEGAIGLAALTGGTAIPVATPVTNTTTANASPSGGLSGLFGGSPRDSSRRVVSVRRARTTTADNSFVPPSLDSPEDDSDLFAELYSETPEPINPNRSTSSTTAHSTLSTTTPARSVERSVSTSGTSFRRSRSRSSSMRRMLPQNLHASFNNGSGGENSINTELPQGSDASLGSSQRNANNSGLLRRFFRRSDGGA